MVVLSVISDIKPIIYIFSHICTYKKVIVALRRVQILHLFLMALPILVEHTIKGHNLMGTKEASPSKIEILP